MNLKKVKRATNLNFEKGQSAFYNLTFSRVITLKGKAIKRKRDDI